MKTFITTTLLTLFFINTMYAQYYSDAGMWNTLNVEKKIKRNFSVFFTEEFRLKENFSQINLFYTDIGIGYRYGKYLKVEMAYRSVEKRLVTDFYSIRHRLMIDITVKKKFKAITLSYRQRFQSEVRNVHSSTDGNVPEWYTRCKAEVKYDLRKKYTPYASCEIRYQFDDPRNVESDKTWHRARYAFGFNYDINKRNTVGLYYLLQREWNVSIPENLYIVGVEYSIRI